MPSCKIANVDASSYRPAALTDPICLFKDNNDNTRKRIKIGSQLTMKAPEQLYWRCSGDFIGVLTLKIFYTFF